MSLPMDTTLAYKLQDLHHALSVAHQMSHIHLVNSVDT